jgi:hypothetical protein
MKSSLCSSSEGGSASLEDPGNDRPLLFAMDRLYPLTDPGLGFVKVWPIGRFDGWNRERERRELKGGDQQGRALIRLKRIYNF